MDLLLSRSPLQRPPGCRRNDPLPRGPVASCFAHVVDDGALTLWRFGSMSVRIAGTRHAGRGIAMYDIRRRACRGGFPVFHAYDATPSRAIRLGDIGLWI